MRHWNLMITGFGSVGWHVANLLTRREERYRQEYNAEVRLVAVAKSQSGLYDRSGLDLADLERFRNASHLQNREGGSEGKTLAECTGPDFVKQAEIDVLIEAGPTNFVTGEPGLSYIRTALENSIHAIAISKGALVLDYSGLASLARANGVMLKISGATAAALPTIDLMHYNLAGCEIRSISGIFTGTTNFILTHMLEEEKSFDEAVYLAQQMGIAEPDPSFDVQGWDTACKLTILANAVFGTSLKLDDIVREGIGPVAPEMVKEWREQAVVPKLVGRIERTAEGVIAQVKTEYVSSDHPFAQVKGTTKAIRVETDVMGDFLVVGGKSDPQAAAAAALKDFEHILQKHMN